MVSESSSHTDTHQSVSYLSSMHQDDKGEIAQRRCNGNVGECMNDDEEMMMESETSRRILEEGARYISYGALERDNVPCNRPGNSYYNCVASGEVNPYSRGCNVITQCARSMW
ncbi:unnamed protein product [Ilex paraguariensis]|uniref:Rapid alkalinization factor n=1 Tax=Ilex paraguariensis TaxID=185542 RepID=A0ABC8TNM7_9AQUA